MEKTIKSYNPATGEIVGEVQITPIERIPEIMHKSHDAQSKWKKLTVDERIDYLDRATQNAAPFSQELIELLSREMGKDLGRSTGEVHGVIGGTSYMAAEVKKALVPQQSVGGTIHYDPLGVVAVISPWNYPLAMFNNLMIPALVAGNTVVLKPSEETPMVAERYIELLNEVLPQNVLQIVHGRREVGKALVDADVQMIAFTGSQAAGRDIMQRAAKGIKRLVMELGGNDPMIVLPDADMRHAARYAVAASLENSGQMCTSTERIYVHSSIKKAFEEEVIRVASQYHTGPWDDERTQVFPIINEKQRSKIIDHIQNAIDQGAKVLLGGTKHPDRYIEPTVLTDVSEAALMSKEETFGPVVSISGYETKEEAIARANNSIYGLGASVFGKEGVEEVAKQLEAGMVGINKTAGSSPWVGAKQSGFGYHGSIDGHRQFTQVKVIS
ncbi:MAG: aldehyde dehydrogenase family protein [bacterium]|nr:aldehyde dehydrogenase family protein [bacterium]